MSAAPAWFCVLILTHSVFGDIRFLERREGDSVVLPCVTQKSDQPPFGLYLMRGWLRPGEVLFKYTGEKFHTNDPTDRERIGVSGDPKLGSLNITITRLTARDTDRYYCQFLVSESSGADRRVDGHTEYFVHISADVWGSVDLELVETCAGGSAVLPCAAPPGGGSAVEGVSLKRKRGAEPVEVLFHSSSSSSSSSSWFPPGSLQLSWAPGPRGLNYNLTLQQLQPEDSALYSCTLLLHGQTDGAALGSRTLYVSVQGAACGCSSYSTLLYALSSAVVVLVLLLLAGSLLLWKGRTRRSGGTQPQNAIYEEMVGCKPASRRLEDSERSEYRNCPVKKSCPENHYESPGGGLK